MLRAVGQPNSRTFARALSDVLDKYRQDCGVRVQTLIADRDVKFSKYFSSYIAREGIEIKPSTNVYHNAFIERHGRRMKTIISQLSRKEDRPWPEVLQEAARINNEVDKIPGTDVTPKEAYEKGNLSKLLRVLLHEKSPQYFKALYNPPVPISDGQDTQLFRYKLGEEVLVDATSVKPSLRGPIVKISEERTKVWHAGRVVDRKLAISTQATMVQRYLVQVPDLRMKFWVYQSSLRAQQ